MNTVPTVDYVKQYGYSRVKNKNTFVKRVVGNTFDIFQGDGWEVWTRVLFVKGRPEVRVMAGQELPFLVRGKLSQLIRSHFYHG